jgi:hypothetical protein
LPQEIVVGLIVATAAEEEMVEEALVAGRGVWQHWNEAVHLLQSRNNLDIL